MTAFDKLKSFDLFAGFSAEEIATLASIATEHAVPRGGTILREGDASNEIFFLFDGEVEFRGGRRG